MKRHTKLFMIFQVVFLIAIIGNPTNTQALGESWEIGTLYTFNYREFDELTITNEKDNTEFNSDFLALGEYFFNITSINNVTKNYVRDGYDSIGNVITSVRSYDAELFSDSELTLSSMYQVDYDWNYEFNTTVLTSVACDIDVEPWYFVEPNWTLINNGFVNSFNESEIVFDLDDPYEPITHNFTLGDVLNETTSFAIMGEDTFPEINQQFVNNLSRWTFVHDFSNKIFFGVYNSTIDEDSYYPYETYKLTLELEYSSGGILQNYYSKMEIKYTSLQKTTYYLDEEGIAYGALPIPTQDSSSAYLLSIPAMLVLVIVYKYQKKKK
ncbi:MAG: hypothetical protein ACTSPM_00065 [Candidatus Heimdallarchaeota archaeon]